MRGLLCTLLGTLVFTSSIFAETIRITNGEWEPFLSNHIYQYGLDSHIVTEAFKLEGVTVEWGFFPWQRAYQHAIDGEHWDASCCWWPDDDTKKEFLMSDVITKTSFVFFHLKSYNFHWNSLQDLKGVQIGGTSKYDYGKEFMQAITAKTLDVDFTLKDEFNYKKLLAGQIQIFPNEPSVGNAQIKNTLSPAEADLLTYNPKKFGISTLHLIISKDNQRNKYFMDKFNAGLKKLKTSGRYQQMLNDLAAGKYDKKK
ncbi:MAG: polar amino acid transport system substrate-binding protein [Alteromonadaceae bacterium]|jgi:polar amino acid transport system substrate-binding protein